mgnify:CR=1 FL=1
MKEDDENTVHNRPGPEPDIAVTPLLSETAAWVADGCHGYVRLGASELSKRTGRSPRRAAVPEATEAVSERVARGRQRRSAGR